MGDDTITLKASCLCKSHVYSATIPKSSLPLEAHFCHCDTCRHVTGSLHLSSAVWPSPRSTVDLSGLKIFGFSPAYKMFFCPTCSSLMFGAFNDETKPLDVCTGALDNFPTDQEVVKWTEMGFVDDTLDGGASVWLRDVNASGSALKCLKNERHGEHAKEVSEDWFSICHNLQSTAERDDVIHIRCKCQGVHFLLHRADYESVSAEDVPWNVDPSTRKLRGEVCGCDSCRLHGGTDVFYWTYVEMKYLTFPEDTEKTGFPQDMYELATLVDKKDPRIGSLAYYRSSAEVQRYFCQTCSATVFYAVSNRPSIIDVAVGLLEMKEGARAESLVAWSLNRGVGYREDGNGGWRQGLFERIGKAVKEYGKKLGSTDKEQQSA